MSQACFLAVLVARASDKLILCSFADPSLQQHRGAAVAQSVTSEQMERVLARFKATPDNATQSFDFHEFAYFVLPDPTAAIIVVCVNRHAAPFNVGAQAAIDTRVQESACRLLEDIQSEFATMYRPELVASASRPYQFIRFDQQLQKLVRRATLSLTASASRTSGASASPPPSTVLRPPLDGADSVSQRRAPGGGGGGGGADATAEAYAMIRNEVKDVHHVMRQNLDDLMTRGERLETMNLYSTQLRDTSKSLYVASQDLNRMRLLKLYGPPAVVVAVLMFVIWWYFF